MDPPPGLPWKCPNLGECRQKNSATEEICPNRGTCPTRSARALRGTWTCGESTQVAEGLELESRLVVTMSRKRIRMFLSQNAK